VYAIFSWIPAVRTKRHYQINLFLDETFGTRMAAFQGTALKVSMRISTALLPRCKQNGMDISSKLILLKTFPDVKVRLPILA
jgi:membrane protease subunit (stomatin/prohibitin family)